MKSLVLLCAILVAAPLPADEKSATFTNLDAPKAIELVKTDAAAAKADPKRTPLTILDVRTPAEFATAHLAGAKNIDFMSSGFKTELGALDKNKPYFVHCASGGRSSKVRDLMKSLGFTSVFHLDGGLKAWQAAGGPVVEAAKK